ncbi:hypothetical protein SDC9_37756 [bioreactor metagenome]|uniref:Uncharacterized protein n=1 Tax=bioreactor metagenome TaxID=1076179 RepID=A0A644VKF9_9ZZZZ
MDEDKEIIKNYSYGVSKNGDIDINFYKGGGKFSQIIIENKELEKMYESAKIMKKAVFFGLFNNK